MLNKQKILIAAALVFSPLVSIQGARSQSVVFTTEELPPYNYTEPGTGKIIGVNTDKVRLLMREAKLEYDIRMLPWARAYDEAQTKSNTCVYTTAYTEARKNEFKWILTLSEDEWVLLSLKDYPHDLKSIDDAKKYRIGGYTGDGKTNYLISNGFKVDVVGDDKLNLRKLFLGRIDFWSYQWTSVEPKNLNFELDGNVLPLKEVISYKKVQTGIACNKDMDSLLYNRMLTAWSKITAG